MAKRTVVLVVYGMLQHRNCGYHEEDGKVGKLGCVEREERVENILMYSYRDRHSGQ
jgi:hypothetical protein